MEPKPTREDRRVRKTRARLSSAFTQLLREKNIQDITVKELTERADVNRGTFYGHYRDLYDMLEQIENDLFADLSDMLDAYDTEDLRHGLKPIMEDTFVFVKKNGGLCSALLESRADDRFFQRLYDMIYEKSFQRWSGSFSIVSVTGGSYTLDFLVAGVVGMVRTWAAGGFQESASFMAVLAERLILRGISPYTY